ncbi:MAG: exodeoxyribonuclease V subunit gamma [Tannerella sp.]|nr:exodeoxyribonuclease V subunit gamma [Tannerella sp.]
MNDYLNQLNDSQREAVLYEDGPTLVVAGAGSGKTRVLTYKIAHLLNSGYQPHTILALTFTNKAAREMKQRIASVTDEYVTRYLWMGTFHSIFSRILRREAEHTDYAPDFTIYDAADSKNLVKAIIKELQLDDKTYRPGMIQSRISNAKNSLMTWNAYRNNENIRKYDGKSNVPETYEIYKRYQNRCLNAGAMDFDEILLQTNILFRDHSDVLAKYQEQFRYVLVDEYQDTNFAQHLIVKRLCEKRQRIFVVGDDAQSIYSFRGANIDNMLRFQENYSDCKIFKLERNYRSTQNIVDAANSLIKNNTEQIRKTVYSENDKGSKIKVLQSYSDYEEAYIVSSLIKDMMLSNDYSYEDFAVLYRTNAQSRILEEIMRKNAIPYNVYGSQSFYQRKEIKDIIAYMRLIVNPNDEESVKRIINYPVRGIGDTTVDKFVSAAVTANVSLWSVILSPEQYSVPINKGTELKILKFTAMMEDFQEQNKIMSVAELAMYVMKNSGLANILNDDISVEGTSRLDNVKELIKAMSDFVNVRQAEGSENISLTDFLIEVSLMTDQDNNKDENTDKITMMTVHAAKGLEFKNVIIVGMENGLFPSQMSIENPRAVEEERRLFYVAITRAKENCIITYSKNRFRNGQTNRSTPSSFLCDIEEKYLNFAETVELPTRKAEYPERNASIAAARRQPSIPFTQPSDNKNLKKIDADTNPPEKPTSAFGLKAGDKVEHYIFGRGEILELEGTGDNAKATVLFDNSGQKNLLLKFAKLKVI